MCSLILLDNLSITQAFHIFVESQKSLILSIFDSSFSEAIPFGKLANFSSAEKNGFAKISINPPDQMVEKISRLVGLVQCGLFNMGAIFSPEFATKVYGANSPLLYQLLKSPETTSLITTASMSNSLSKSLSSPRLIVFILTRTLLKIKRC